MTTVTRHESPSEQLIAKAIEEFATQDARGRVFKLRKPGLLQQFRLVEVIGESAKNEVYLNMCRPLIFIASIDGDPITQPLNKLELEGLITRVGDEGLDAVFQGIVKHFGVSDPAADKAALKK